MSTPRAEPDPAERKTPKVEASPRGLRRLSLAGLLILFVLPLALRLRPIGHGMPRNYVPDTHMVRQALGMARDKDPVPPVGKYSTYPNLVPYVLLPCYVGYFVGGVVTGTWSGSEEFKEAVTADASGVQLIARVLVALFGALTPWVVFRIARVSGLRGGAWVAAWLVAVGVLHTHFSVQERPWVPMVFFLALACWPAALYVSAPRLRLLVLSGLAAGAAAACHQSGMLALGVPGLAWALSTLSFRGADLKARLIQGTASVACFGLVWLVIGNPHYLVHGRTTLDATIGGGAGDIAFAGQSHRFAWRLGSLEHMASAFFGYDPVLVVLALCGLPLALRVRAARPATVFALCWAVYFMPHDSDHVRYLLPLAVLLAIPAGFSGEWLLARGKLGVGALAGLLALALAQDLRFGHVLSSEDTRALAERDVPPLLPEGARLAVDRYGPAFDLDVEALTLLLDLRSRQGGELSTRERARVQRAETEPIGGVDALNVWELLSTDERAGKVWLSDPALEGRTPEASDPPERLLAALRAEGATHLLLVDRDPRDPSGCLLRPLVEGREPLLVIDPSAEDDGFDEARLPTDMDFPLTALWQVERPGPWMALYDLR